LDETCVYLDLSSREYLLAAVDDLARSADAPTMIFITQRIEEITASFNKGMILGAGRVQSVGDRSEILTAENLSAAFGMKIRLYARPDGRFWPVPE
ncbi:MAG: molybdenum ABC transporter ATP-binding protein, partial [Lentisphaeria bacterium]|nr:molybdenum ABC transporter ATP-binding protein [Lentisphaeria bacterium]